MTPIQSPLLIIAMLFYTSLVLANDTENKTFEQSILLCHQEPAPLLRLSCYDKIHVIEKQNTTLDIRLMGDTWQRIIEHEMQRKPHTAGFIISQPQKGTYPVLMTIPAIGHQPPRPVLMLSCIDNITRMQIALPWQQHTSDVRFITNKTQFDAQWFLREDGYLLESSRGLAGIEEIKRLLSGETLTLKSRNNNPLTFNISGLNEEIEPLRSACHW